MCSANGKPGVKPVVNESGIEIKTVYTAGDIDASGGIDESLAGEPPFTRGIHAEMYRRQQLMVAIEGQG